jgi:hypothetical protein
MKVVQLYRNGSCGYIKSRTYNLSHATDMYTGTEGDKIPIGRQHRHDDKVHSLL